METGSHSHLEILTLHEVGIGRPASIDVWQVEIMVDSAEAKVMRLAGRTPGQSSESESDSSDGPQRGRSYIAGNSGGQWLPANDSLHLQPHRLEVLKACEELRRLPWKVLYYNTRSIQASLSGIQLPCGSGGLVHDVCDQLAGESGHVPAQYPGLKQLPRAPNSFKGAQVLGFLCPDDGYEAPELHLDGFRA